MTDEEFLDQLHSVFSFVFNYDGGPLTMSMTSEDIPAWDSMSNITLAIELEHHFGIKIKIAEMESLKNIQDLMSLVKSRQQLPTH